MPMTNFAWRRKSRGQRDNYCRRCRAVFRKRPCADRGETDPLALEFDHLGHKNFNISSSLRNNNWQAVLDEIATCDVVCANCHR
jgi:hypothetical protein